MQTARLVLYSLCFWIGVIVSLVGIYHIIAMLIAFYDLKSNAQDDPGALASGLGFALATSHYMQAVLVFAVGLIISLLSVAVSTLESFMRETRSVFVGQKD